MAVIVRRIPPVACTITPCIDTRELVDQDGNNPTHRDIFSTPRRLRELDQQIADVDTQTDSVSEIRDKFSLSQTSVTDSPWSVYVPVGYGPLANYRWVSNRLCVTYSTVFSRTTKIDFYYDESTIRDECVARRRECQVLTTLHTDTTPGPIDFTELDMSQKDLTRLPIVLTLLYMHGKFGGNTRGYYDNAYLSSLKRIGAVGTKLTTFKSIVRNDFLNKTSILSRVAAILIALVLGWIQQELHTL